MRKIMGKLGIALLMVALFVSTTTISIFANEVEDPYVCLEQQGFKIITSNSMYSMEKFDAENIESNILFDQQAFASVLESKPKALREAIYEGNIIAVFDDSNKSNQYEKKMNLPLGFDTMNNSKGSTHKSIGYIYQSDACGGIHVTRVNVHRSIDSEEEKIYTFMDILSNYANKAATPMAVTEDTMEPEEKFVDSIGDYYRGDGEKGDVSVMYEVSTVQDVGKYDYYIVHAYIDATPGRALYEDGKHDADILTVSLGTTTSGATFYKTGPNTTTSDNEYSVDIGLEISGSGNNKASIDISWKGTLPDVEIIKKLKSSKKCEWKVDIDDSSSASEGTISFEPGGTFRVAKNKEGITVESGINFKVDSWYEQPSSAVIDDISFYCTPEVLEFNEE